jgi:hypothetical protein
VAIPRPYDAFGEEGRHEVMASITFERAKGSTRLVPVQLRVGGQVAPRVIDLQRLTD